MPLTCWFSDCGKKDVQLVGGKNASLGEMISKTEVPVPQGFSITSEAYDLILSKAGIREKMRKILQSADLADPSQLKEAGRKVRNLIRKSKIPQELEEEILAKYEQLGKKLKEKNPLVAVRSSATAEDLPTASFAGQMETYLNISGKKRLLKAVKKCMASLFTNRGISYREDKGFDHFKVKISVGVQQMVDSECSGVLFTIDPDSGFEKVVYINGGWGLGELTVGGKINPDEFFWFKPTEKIISKKLGTKLEELRREKGRNVEQKVPTQRRNKFVLSDEEVDKLANYSLQIHKHYGSPQDIEWAKDKRNKKLYIVQSRPETVHAPMEKKVIKSYKLKGKGIVICTGNAIGRKIGSGKANVIIEAEKMNEFEEGQVLVTDMTDPDWEPIMKTASAIITDKGGSTSHAAIISRELGIPAVVGTRNATHLIKSGQFVTVDCSSGKGKIWKGKLSFDVLEKNVAEVPPTKTKVMMNVGVPGQAFDLGQYPVGGVGLARQEFIIGSHIGEHPLKMAEENREEEFVQKLMDGIAKIAAGFYPKPVIVRLSDFKTNEYVSLKGGEKFENEEANPMLGWRGASRYRSKKFRKAFQMECEALQRVRDELGLKNVKIMIPFCRTLKEAEESLEVMKANGLERGKNGLEIYMMAEIPSNIILAEEFAKFFDGFSIGTNDLTQLTLGVDRDNEELLDLFDERNEAVKQSVQKLIEQAHRKGCKVGICGDAPSTHSEYAKFLVSCGIDSISVTPDMALTTIMNVAEAEKS